MSEYKKKRPQRFKSVILLIMHFTFIEYKPSKKRIIFALPLEGKNHANT